MQTIIVGVDIGAESTKVVLGPSQGSEIVRNQVGGHTTPTLLSFGDQGDRHIGATANAKAKSAIPLLNRWLHGEQLEEDPLTPFCQSQRTAESASLTVSVKGEPKTFSPSSLIAMLLGQVHKDVRATIQRRSEGDSGDSATSKYQYVLACPPNLSEQAQQELLDAAYAVDLALQLVPRGESYNATYQRKFPDYADAKHYTLLVDMGHAETTVTIFGPPGEEESSKDKTEEEESKEAPAPVGTALVTLRKQGLGAGSVDTKLWEHFVSTVPSLKDLKKTNRGGQRLLVGVAKLKHLLSQLPEASVTVENVGVNDTDLKLDCSRSQLVELCDEHRTSLESLIQETLQAAKITASQLHAVEVVGGGCRIPWVKESIERITEITSLSYSMDDTSAAMGAALLGESEDMAKTTTILAESAAPDKGASETQTALRAQEEALAALDAALKARAATLNQLEAHILELRSAKHDTKHGTLLPSELFGYLDQTEDWLFSEEADLATHEVLQAKWDEVETKTQEWAKDYQAAVDAENKAKEAEMEVAAKEAQKERDGEEANGEEDDHDNRRLPKKRRMEIVIKNKKEGGELFSDGNYKFAAARYAKALSHCAKFVDLNPDDIEEVNAMKLTLNMNLGLAYLKMKNPDQALRYCNDALAIDGKHTKALYRRASVYYERKNWAAASKDLKEAAKIVPDDKAIQKLQEKVDAQLKRQKLKEKKMAQKMFG